MKIGIFLFLLCKLVMLFESLANCFFKFLKLIFITQSSCHTPWVLVSGRSSQVDC